MKEGGKAKVDVQGKLNNIKTKKTHKIEYHQLDVECYNCGKRGHYAREYRYRRAEGNVVTSTQPQVQSEKEWDFNIQASCAIGDQVKNGSSEFVKTSDSENEWDVSVPSAILGYLEESYES